MQIKNLSLIILSAFLLACNNASEVKDALIINSPVAIDTIAKTETVIAKEVYQDTSGMNGFYVGDFNAIKYDVKKKPMYSNLINMIIDSIVEKKVYGHTVVAGNDRPFSGTIIEESQEVIQIEVKEPGDDKYDGVFKITYDVKKRELDGSWAANDPKLSVTLRGFHLKKRYFKYDAKQELGNSYRSEVYDSFNENDGTGESITEDAGKLNPSAVELKPEDIQNMYKRDLEVMRNSIYARHGYSFKNRVMRQFFDRDISWYIPVSTDVSAQLTELEKRNIALIKTYEKHAESYYDSFGR